MANPRRSPAPVIRSKAPPARLTTKASASPPAAVSAPPRGGAVYVVPTLCLLWCGLVTHGMTRGATALLAGTSGTPASPGVQRLAQCAVRASVDASRPLVQQRSLPAGRLAGGHRAHRLSVPPRRGRRRPGPRPHPAGVL